MRKERNQYFNITLREEKENHKILCKQTEFLIEKKTMKNINSTSFIQVSFDENNKFSFEKQKFIKITSNLLKKNVVCQYFEMDCKY